MKISVDEYHHRLTLAISCYYESVQLSKNLTETQKNRKQLIPTDHPAFDFWLSLHLTTVEHYDIPLILDEYHRGQFGEIDNFIGHVEFFVKRIIKNNIFYTYDLHMKEIVNWVRETRREENKAIPVNQTIIIGELNIHLNQENIEQHLDILFDQRSIKNEFNSNLIFYNETTENKEELINSGESINVKELHLIETGLDYNTVLNYFMQLYLVKNLKSENYLKEEDVVDLVLSNFLFKNIDSKKIRKQFKIKIQKQVLIQFVYCFF